MKITRTIKQYRMNETGTIETETTTVIEVEAEVSGLAALELLDIEHLLKTGQVKDA